MNENIDLTKILKDCPEGTVFWSDNYGEVQLLRIDTSIENPIRMKRSDGYSVSYTKEGWCRIEFPASCLLWPSRDSRDWSKFSASWHKKGRFDPKTLQPFDRVLARIDGGNAYCWFADFVSTPTIEKYDLLPCIMSNKDANMIIPYNDDTKHLVGTTEEAPEYYRYWED